MYMQIFLSYFCRGVYLLRHTYLCLSFVECYMCPCFVCCWPTFLLHVWSNCMECSSYALVLFFCLLYAFASFFVQAYKNPFCSICVCFLLFLSTYFSSSQCCSHTKHADIYTDRPTKTLADRHVPTIDNLPVGIIKMEYVGGVIAQC